MSWAQGAGKIIYDELRHVSRFILTKLKCYTEPHEIDGVGKTRTCRFKPFINGKRSYKGILFHYTGGISSLIPLKWANCPTYGNHVSSWHVTILDRIPDNIIGEAWSKIDDELRILFPVPTIIMADFRWGTWHGNWTNNVTLGVENRNSGCYGHKKMSDGLAKLGKRGFVLEDKIWEEYTREQIIANINLGRLANSLIKGRLDPDWVLTHQCIKATKQDCGPAYPIHAIREAIFNRTESDPHTTYQNWLKNYPMAPDTNTEFDEEFEYSKESRAEDRFVPWVEPDHEKPVTNKQSQAVSALYNIGFNVGNLLNGLRNEEDELRLQKMVRWYQRSTHAGKSQNALKPHGILDEKTIQSLKQRLTTFRIDF